MTRWNSEPWDSPELLGPVGPSTSLANVARRFRARMLNYHPDKQASKPPERRYANANARTKALSRAREEAEAHFSRVPSRSRSPPRSTAWAQRSQSQRSQSRSPPRSTAQTRRSPSPPPAGELERDEIAKLQAVRGAVRNRLRAIQERGTATGAETGRDWASHVAYEIAFTSTRIEVTVSVAPRRTLKATFSRTRAQGGALQVLRVRRREGGWSTVLARSDALFAFVGQTLTAGVPAARG